MKLKPMYFEDFSVGMTFQTDETLISKKEIIDFASKYDPQTFHLDEEEAKKGGAILIIQDGILKALEGETTVEEVFRVAK